MNTKRERWPVIDTHFHIGVHPGSEFIAEEQLLPWMDKYGIDRQIVMQVNEGFQHKTPEWNPFVGNDYVGKIQKMFPDRVIGVATVNPWLQPPKKYFYGPKAGESFDLVTRNPVLEELDRCVLELGLWGLKMHPYEHGYQINNPCIINPIMERLTELQEKAGKQLFIFIHAAGETLNNSPEAVADIARQFPNLLFIASHSGYRWGTPTVAHTMAPLPNVLLDLTTVGHKQGIWESFEKYGAKKFCNGTDAPFVSVGMSKAIARDLCRTEEEYERVQGANLAEWLGIPKIVI